MKKEKLTEEEIYKNYIYFMAKYELIQEKISQDIKEEKTRIKEVDDEPTNKNRNIEKS